MNTTPPAAPPPSVAEPVIVRASRLRLSLVWIVPLVALVAGAILVVRTITQTGPMITITFRSADGLEAGRTDVRYKEVTIGRVASVALSPDRGRALVRVRLNKSAAELAVADTKFWIVRPRVGTGGISGLGTLLSGAYIGTDAGESPDEERFFTGLEAPPFVMRGEQGRTVVLDAPDLGSLDVGSPVFYRRTRVGRVVGYTLNPQTDRLEVRLFIEAPNESLVTRESRFWNASGVDVTVNASGLNVNTESLASLVGGGIAFGNPPGVQGAAPAPDGQRFTLYADRRAALAPADGPPQRVRFVFDPGMRGLAAGAPVELLGNEIGNVRSVVVHYDARRGRFPTEVQADIYLSRLGEARDEFLKSAGAGSAPADVRFLQRLVGQGLRASLKSGSILTGQPYVSLDLARQAPRAALVMAGNVATLPTLAGGSGDLQAQAGEVLDRLARIDFEAIGARLEQALKNAGEAGATAQGTLRSAGEAAVQLQKTLEGADGAIRQLAPPLQAALVEAQSALKALQGTLGELDRNVAQPDAPLQRSAGQTLSEMQRAARALRVLGDYLQQHPESLLRGKPDDPETGMEGRR
ncbi:MAG: MlaD family protein [Rubrivivax sp.]